MTPKTDFFVSSAMLMLSNPVCGTVPLPEFKLHRNINKTFLETFRHSQVLKTEVSVIWQTFNFWVALCNGSWVLNLTWFFKLFLFVYLFIYLISCPILYSIILFLISLFQFFYKKNLIKTIFLCMIKKTQHDPWMLFLKSRTVVIIFWNFLKFYQVFLSPQVKCSLIISKKWCIQVASWVAKNLMLKNIGNYKILEKSQNYIELWSIAQSSSQVIILSILMKN